MHDSNHQLTELPEKQQKDFRESLKLRLELKVLADVGLLGKPNAGSRL